MGIGNNIKALREAKHWSQYDLAYESGLKRGIIATIENELSKKIDYFALTKIADALGTTIEELSKEDFTLRVVSKDKNEILSELDQTINDLQIIVKKLRSL